MGVFVVFIPNPKRCPRSAFQGYTSQQIRWYWHPRRRMAERRPELKEVRNRGTHTMREWHTPNKHNVPDSPPNESRAPQHTRPLGPCVIKYLGSLTYSTYTTITLHTTYYILQSYHHSHAMIISPSPWYDLTITVLLCGTITYDTSHTIIPFTVYNSLCHVCSGIQIFEQTIHITTTVLLLGS